MYHGGSGPWWLAVLVAAQEWGCTPWEIAGGSKLAWYHRWVEYKTNTIQAQQQRRKLAEFEGKRR